LSASPPAAQDGFERSLPAVLLAMTAVTGLVDAVSFLALGRVFTANMTGNVVFIAFALTGVPELSVPRSLVALAAFLAGAVVGGRLVNRKGARGGKADAPARSTLTGFALEVAFLAASAIAAIGFVSGPAAPARLYALIVLTGLAMGIRNAVVRKLAVPDLTTTVLTLTITGLGADSPLAGGDGVRWKRRVGSILAMLAGAAAGALLVRRSVALTLALASAASAVCALASWRARRHEGALREGETAPAARD
jgi:uncharacterized membrane protein YoaK (UPF0700 family)